MKRWESGIVPGGLIVAGLVFLFAAIRPSFGEGDLNVPFLLAAVVCVGAGIAFWRGRNTGGTKDQ